MCRILLYVIALILITPSVYLAKIEQSKQNSRRARLLQQQKENVIQTLKSRYKKSDQQTYRYGVYQKNQKSIKEHNKNTSSTYKRGKTENMYEDPKEFLGSVLMELPGPPPEIKSLISVPFGSSSSPSKTIDWRKHFTVARHQNAKCGSCYAFSVTYILQAYYHIQTSQFKNYSEQQLVDCCKDGCNGCKGGWPAKSLQYLANRGIASLQQYPYKAKASKCQSDEQKQYEKILNVEEPYIDIDSVAGLLYALEKGPVNVIIDAMSWDPLYKQGVFDKCPKQNVVYNHAVICVGVKKDRTWIVRNSWGPKWGDKGHIYLPSGNSCGIADRGLIPILSIEGNQEEEQEQDNADSQDETQEDIQTGSDSDDNQQYQTDDSDNQQDQDQEQGQDPVEDDEQSNEDQNQDTSADDQNIGYNPFSLNDWIKRKKRLRNRN